MEIFNHFHQEEKGKTLPLETVRRLGYDGHSADLYIRRCTCNAVRHAPCIAFETFAQPLEEGRLHIQVDVVVSERDDASVSEDAEQCAVRRPPLRLVFLKETGQKLQLLDDVLCKPVKGPRRRHWERPIALWQRNCGEVRVIQRSCKPLQVMYEAATAHPHHHRNRNGGATQRLGGLSGVARNRLTPTARKPSPKDHRHSK